MGGLKGCLDTEVHNNRLGKLFIKTSFNDYFDYQLN